MLGLLKRSAFASRWLRRRPRAGDGGVRRAECSASRPQLLGCSIVPALMLACVSAPGEPGQPARSEAARAGMAGGEKQQAALVVPALLPASNAPASAPPATSLKDQAVWSSNAARPLADRERSLVLLPGMLSAHSSNPLVRRLFLRDGRRRSQLTYSTTDGLGRLLNLRFDWEGGVARLVLPPAEVRRRDVLLAVEDLEGTEWKAVRGALGVRRDGERVSVHLEAVVFEASGQRSEPISGTLSGPLAVSCLRAKVTDGALDWVEDDEWSSKFCRTEQPRLLERPLRPPRAAVLPEQADPSSKNPIPLTPDR